MWTNLGSIVQALFARLQIQREEGQALVEYTLILALIAIVVIAALSGLATAIGNELGTIAGKL